MGRSLRSKRLRSVLFRAADGRCQICGCELTEAWHADHIVPWVVSKRTNVHEMQALCPECNLRKGISMQTESVFKFSAEFREQSGQRAMWDLAANVDLHKKNSFFAHLCTGYGKTLLSYGMFAVLKSRGLVDCMLVLVPGDDQRTQFVDDAEDARLLIGVDAKPWVAEKQTREIIGVKRGDIDVLVATYQQLSDGFFNEVFEGKRVFLVADECHHLAKTWGHNTSNLKREATLFLSATPVRNDEKKLANVPDTPDVLVSYREAYKEKVVRRIYGEIDHFTVHVTCDGEKKTLTTKDLRDDGVTDFSKYEAKKRLRYDADYLDWMLLSPLQELSHRRLTQPGEHQMLVFAMSCKHADHICNQIRQVADSVGYTFSADWVGVGEGIDGQFKDDKENKRLINKYRKGELDILVQVDKAGEGFSVKRASVLVFVHLIGFDGKLMQQLGRGIRRNQNIDFDKDSCVVFASADTDLARLVVEMEQSISEVDDKPESAAESETQLRLFDIDELMLVESKHDHTELVGGVLSENEKAVCDQFKMPYDVYLQTAEGRRSRAIQEKTIARERDTFASIKDQVKQATATLCGNVIRIYRKNGIPVDGKVAGQIKHKINSQWIMDSQLGHDAMLRDEFEAKHLWLQTVNHDIRVYREVPRWLR